MSTPTKLETVYNIEATEAVLRIEKKLDRIKYIMRVAQPTQFELAELKELSWGIQKDTIPVIVYAGLNMGEGE